MRCRPLNVKGHTTVRNLLWRICARSKTVEMEATVDGKVRQYRPRLVPDGAVVTNQVRMRRVAVDSTNELSLRSSETHITRLHLRGTDSMVARLVPSKR